MADISMCFDKTCPSRMQCYRYTAHQSPYWQSFMDFDREGESRCDSFWDNKGRSMDPKIREELARD